QRVSEDSVSMVSVNATTILWSTASTITTPTFQVLPVVRLRQTSTQRRNSACSPVISTPNMVVTPVRLLPLQPNPERTIFMAAPTCTIARKDLLRAISSTPKSNHSNANSLGAQSVGQCSRTNSSSSSTTK